jgi:hypothetical protein
MMALNDKVSNGAYGNPNPFGFGEWAVVGIWAIMFVWLIVLPMVELFLPDSQADNDPRDREEAFDEGISMN